MYMYVYIYIYLYIYTYTWLDFHNQVVEKKCRVVAVSVGTSLIRKRPPP